jgi:hypothetical protein
MKAGETGAKAPVAPANFIDRLPPKLTKISENIKRN